MSWQYANEDRKSVFQTLPDGVFVSYLVDSQEIQNYLASGGIIMDEPTPPKVEIPLSLDQIVTILSDKGIITKTDIEAQQAVALQAASLDVAVP